MLRIAKLTDYGVVLVSLLAGREERVWSVPELASHSGIPEPTVAKVLKRLARGEIVRSHRGARGGYQLARAPGAISVSEVIDALEGPIAVTECSTAQGASGCEYEGGCEVRAHWRLINHAVQDALSRITVADMTRSSPSDLVRIGRGPSSRSRLSMRGHGSAAVAVER